MKIICRTWIILLCCALSACRGGKNEWIDLFNGKDLNGWKAGENSESFKVEKGLLICSGPRSHLFYQKDKYKNFELEAEIMTDPGANSGIFFHTEFKENEWPGKGYEIQINNTNGGAGNHREREKTGSLYGIRNVYYQYLNDNEWFNLRIRVVENHIGIFLNDVLVVDYIEPENPWRSDIQKNRLIGEGLIALQAHDEKSRVYFRTVRVKKLAAGEKLSPAVSEEWDSTVTKLTDMGFPLVDYHVHIKGTLTTEEAIGNSLRLGINYGIAPNCGLHFPVTNDSSLYAYLKEMEGKPIFKGMQAEGREWITLFSSKAVSEFDYVFTDAMTFTDSRGRRNRIWIPEEVWVDDKQQFMEQLIGKIEAIFSQEPVDIYVNPTVLPAALSDEYDDLWTEERMARVIKVLADNDIALEINARYKVPKPGMIIMAKNAGIKFSFGTNNTGNELGQLEYCLEMIEKCGLTPEDIFMPKADNLKPVNVKGLPEKITG